MPRRRYDLDWLRVGVFGLLILFHSGMFYVANWGWHAKSTYQSAFLENIMLIVEPWRMPILWLIAGISIRFILAKVPAWRFVFMRSLRLLLPLLFGVLVVVPPQLYVEMTMKGELSMSYWQFLQVFFTYDHPIFANYRWGIWPHIDVNHLWFLRSLWKYSLVILLLAPVLNSKWIENALQWLFRQHNLVAISLAVLPIFLIHINWDIHSARYPLGFTLMLYGYLIGWNPAFWQRLTHQIKPLLLASAVCFAIFITFYNLVWVHAFQGKQVSENLMIMGMLVYSLLRVLGVLTVFAIGFKYFNRKSKSLGYLNEAVYPFYILHQSIIVVAGYQLSQFALGPVWEPILLILITIIACFAGFELILRVELLRPFFGLKMSNSYSLPLAKIGCACSLLLLLPFAYEILL